MIVTKLKFVAGMLFCVALVATAGGTWDRQAPPASLIAVAANTDAAQDKPRPKPAPHDPRKASDVERIAVRGMVRDELGRPAAQAWVGAYVSQYDDVWKRIAADRIRDHQDPYRDNHGKIVPPGDVGRNFELRDERRSWQPVHPHNIRRYDPQRLTSTDLRSDGSPVAQAPANVSPFEVRVAEGHWYMSPSSGATVDRTDAEGRFAVDVEVPSGFSSQTLHVASRDFSRRAVRVVRAADANQPIEITLKPARLVHARVIETPIDRPDMLLEWACTQSVKRRRAFSITSRSRRSARSGATGPRNRFRAGLPPPKDAGSGLSCRRDAT